MNFVERVDYRVKTKESKKIRNQRKNRNHLDNNVVKIGQNN